MLVNTTKISNTLDVLLLANEISQATIKDSDCVASGRCRS